MSNQIVTYEPQHGGAAYIYLVGDIPSGGVKRTMQVSPDINLDFDAMGRLIGIELLNGALLHPDLFARAIKPGMEELTVRAEDDSKPIHYGPEWAWDYTRPEAIVALRQMEEAHRICFGGGRDPLEPPTAASATCDVQ